MENQTTATEQEDQPLRWRPHFLREIEGLADDIGIIDATRTLLERDNITVQAQGDIDRLANHEAGLLFAGDHRKQWEFAALMDVLSRIGRQDMLNVAKFYVEKQVVQAIGHEAAKNIVPVYPRILARDLKHGFDSELISRLQYRRSLLSAEESLAANNLALARASESLELGGVVNIFPCGSVVDARLHAWRQGIGRIVQQLPADAKEQTLVSLYRLGDEVSWRRLLAAVAVRGRGIAGRPQIVKLEIAPIRTAAEVVGSLAVKFRDDPACITEELRRDFMANFG